MQQIWLAFEYAVCNLLQCCSGQHDEICAAPAQVIIYYLICDLSIVQLQLTSSIRSSQIFDQFLIPKLKTIRQSAHRLRTHCLVAKQEKRQMPRKALIASVYLRVSSGSRSVRSLSSLTLVLTSVYPPAVKTKAAAINLVDDF